MLRHAREALRLRNWALRVITGSPPDGPPRCGARGASLFLGVERCAVALQERLSRANAAETTAPLPQLRSHATAEARRALAARAELRGLDATLTAAGVRAIVLKGGAAIATGPEHVDLSDIDLLAPPGEASELARLLEGVGYHQRAPDPVTTKHLGPLGRPGGLAVEVHRWPWPGADIEEIWKRARPAPPLRSILVPAPLDNAWHVLLHATATHPERRGCIRDVLLIARALPELDEAARRELRARVHAHRLADVMGWMLDCAAAVAPSGGASGHAAPPRVDALSRDAATAYLALQAVEWAARAVRPPAGLTELAHSLGSAHDAGRWARRLFGPLPFPPKQGALRGLARSSPAAYRGVAMALRLAKQLVAVPLGLGLAAGGAAAARLEREPAVMRGADGLSGSS